MPLSLSHTHNTLLLSVSILWFKLQTFYVMPVCFLLVASQSPWLAAFRKAAAAFLPVFKYLPHSSTFQTQLPVTNSCINPASCVLHVNMLAVFFYFAFAAFLDTLPPPASAESCETINRPVSRITSTDVHVCLGVHESNKTGNHSIALLEVKSSKEYL